MVDVHGKIVSFLVNEMNFVRFNFKQFFFVFIFTHNVNRVSDHTKIIMYKVE